MKWLKVFGMIKVIFTETKFIHSISTERVPNMYAIITQYIFNLSIRQITVTLPMYKGFKLMFHFEHPVSANFFQHYLHSL